MTKVTNLDLPEFDMDQFTPGAWLAGRCPDAELWLRRDDGHVSVLRSCGVAALDGLVAHA